MIKAKMLAPALSFFGPVGWFFAPAAMAFNEGKAAGGGVSSGKKGVFPNGGLR